MRQVMYHAGRHWRRELALIVALGLPFILYGILRNGADTVVSETYTDARVTEVKTASKDTRSTQVGKTSLITVELNDGGRARLWVPSNVVKTGDHIQVRVETFEDGTRRVTRTP